MFCQSFPDLAWLKKQAESRFANQRGWNNQALSHTGWPTVILNVRAGETYRDNIPGPLSLFTNLNGQSWVEADGKRTRVAHDAFVVTNAGQRYTLEIEKQQPAETLNIHFGEHWAEEAWVSLQCDTPRLLDQPDRARFASLHFHQKLHPKPERLQLLLRELVATHQDGNLKREELLFQVLQQLLQAETDLRDKGQQLSVLKKSTREEVLNRLIVATDYMHAYADRPLSLDELARVGCLSKFHFLRLFKQFHHITPHQYLTRLRIAKSKELLLQPHVGVSQVARQLGFEHARSFSRLFFQQAGMLPTQYVDAHRK